MGTNISVYLSDAALTKLDGAVAKRAAADRAKGLSGRKVSNRSSVLEQLIRDGLDADSVLDRATIQYYAVSLGEAYGAKKVSLFGSYARGDATPESDVDLLVEKGDMRGMRVLDFQDDIAKALGKRVDVVTTAGASDRFLGKIKSDEVVLYEAR